MIRYHFLFYSFLICMSGLYLNADQSPVHAAPLEKDNQRIAAYSAMIARYYDMNENEHIKDITESVLAEPTTPNNVKEAIRANQRHIYVFKYPSDGLMVKGFISLTPESQNYPLLVLFRGGNRDFGLPNPADRLVNYQHYAVISSTLRDGINAGRDEFGGADVNDMKNLIEFIPTLEKKLLIKLQTHSLDFLGISRGGMEMFLTLSRYPELQNRVNRVISLSGLLDLRRQMLDRPEMKEMFEEDFGLQNGNEEEWIQQRTPLMTISHLKKCLPVLIVQGTADSRINLAEGYEMVRQLHDTGHAVDYWEIEGGNHILSNHPQPMDLITYWLKTAHSSC
ncbi:putative secreted protein [Candidatus Protochlamydia naegleriophila]|uniref:Putative secreted protein n=1 Tax=Candidatus Protochlamydia naegleriophila TaxID=389348 RepID=A0A0U5CPS6_9BACT|nr:prolyl oligopeptidase family serine peptidase [Candidatus Protochlamydia naegleriophila]CUI16780.1 putative secreted protein [Candidatus Protochlamydia naegleriophila]